MEGESLERSVLEASMWYVEEPLYLRQTLLETGKDERSNKILHISHHENLQITHLYKHNQM